MFRAVHSRQGREAGFTIIETLVALAVVTAVLAGIGTLIATSARGTSALERHVELAETARAIASALPGSGKLVGDTSGELAGLRWRVDVLPFAADDSIRNCRHRGCRKPSSLRFVLRTAGPFRSRPFVSGGEPGDELGPLATTFEDCGLHAG